MQTVQWSIYIGQTGLRLFQQLTEHKRAVRMADFNLAWHAWSASHHVDWENTCVLSNCSDYARITQEAIYLLLSYLNRIQALCHLFMMSLWML